MTTKIKISQSRSNICVNSSIPCILKRISILAKRQAIIILCE